MNNKKIGITFLIISILIAGVMLQFMGGLNNEAEQLGCFSEDSCEQIQQQISLTHIGFGFIGFLFALGFYLLFFSVGEQAVLDKLQSVESRRSEEEKFMLLLRGLDAYEKKALSAIKEQEGITQSTLRLRTDMSKAKLSYVLTDLEGKSLIKRIPKGKTFSLYLK